MKSLSARLEKRIKPSREEGLNVMEMVREEEELMSGGKECDGLNWLYSYTWTREQVIEATRVQ